MNTRKPMILCAYPLLLASLAFGSAFAQQVEVEPNDSCQQPQDLTGLSLPLAVQGELLAAGGPDVDFFKILGAPGEQIFVTLAGAASGAGTLQTPFLLLYDSDCRLIAADFSQAGEDARLRISVPDDGVIVAEANQCCEPGTYRLSVDPVLFAGSIGGRIVDAETGEPLPFSDVALLDCSDACQVVNALNASEDGSFVFTGDFFGQPLIAGRYQINASREPIHPSGQFGPYDLAEGEDLDVGDLGLNRQAFISSISGRLVDALSGEPVPGMDFPFSLVFLLRCGDEENCSIVSIQFLDGSGRFFFSEPFLPVGLYRVRIEADQYQRFDSDIFEVGEDEDFDLGDLRANPLPVQFLNVRRCDNIPSQGGTCRFTMDVRNGRTTRYKGSVWALVSAFEIGSLVDFSEFQIGKNGAVNPMPEVFNLASGKSLKADFEFEVPGSVRDRAMLCLRAFAGEQPNPQLNTLGVRPLFCLVKEADQFRAMSANEVRQLLLKQGGPAARLVLPD